jgi:hypothetical protein
MITTNTVTAVASGVATLNGSLSEPLGNVVNVCFDYRMRGDTAWTRTTLQPTTIAFDFSANISGLVDNANYEYRAVGITAVPAETYGSTVIFGVGNLVFVNKNNQILNTILNNLVDSPLIVSARNEINQSTTTMDEPTRTKFKVNFELTIAKDLTQAAMQLAASMQGMEADVTQKYKQIEQTAAEIANTIAKTAVMKQSEIDNLVIEALKAALQQIATVGAGGLVPSTADFSAANDLRDQTYKRAQQLASGMGVTLPNITFTAGTAYTKAT